MKICICGGTNPATDAKWLSVAGKLGKLLCENDFEMVWGGNAHGVLALIHQEYVKAGKPNTLVLPKAYEEDLKTMNAQDVVKTDLVAQRTHSMFQMTDAVVIIPGGIGTIYEFWAAVEGKRAGEYDINIFVLNHEGFFNHPLAHFDFINANGFTKVGQGGAPYKIKPQDLFKVVSTPAALIRELNKVKSKNEKPLV